MLEKITENLWVARQPLRYMGLNVGTRMSVVRLSNQKLAVISAIAPTNTLINELSHIGEVEHIIAPNLYHTLYAERFKACYPNATLWGTDGIREKKPTLPIDKIIQPDDSSLWQDLAILFLPGLKTLGFNGFDAFNEWVFFHASSHTLIVTDAAFYYDASFPFVERLVARVLGCYETLRPSVLEWVATKDKQSLRTAIEQVFSWDFDRVIVAHGSVVERGGKAMLKEGYEQFLGQPISKS